MALDDLAASRCFSGYDSGGEVIGKAPGDRGVVWSEGSGVASSSHGPVEDSGDGGSSDVSAKAGA